MQERQEQRPAAPARLPVSLNVTVLWPGPEPAGWQYRLAGRTSRVGPSVGNDIQICALMLERGVCAAVDRCACSVPWQLRRPVERQYRLLPFRVGKQRTTVNQVTGAQEESPSAKDDKHLSREVPTPPA